MKLIVCTREAELAVLLTKCERLLHLEGVDFQAIILDRKEYMGSLSWPFYYREEFQYGIELFTAERLPSLEPDYTLAKIKPITVNEFNQINPVGTFEEYLKNFYDKYQNGQYDFEIKLETEKEFLRRHNTSDYLGCLCANIYDAYESETIFPKVHQQLSFLIRFLKENFNTTIEYIFPPPSFLVMGLEGEWNEEEQGNDYCEPEW